LSGLGPIQGQGLAASQASLAPMEYPAGRTVALGVGFDGGLP